MSQPDSKVRCKEPEVPLVLYAADFPYSSYTNLSSNVDYLSPFQVIDLTSNALQLISQDSDRLRADWTSCLACGAIYRSLQRMNWAIPEVCEKCMDEYCWDGAVSDSEPGFLSPTLVLDSLSWGEWNATVFHKDAIL